MSRQRYRYLLFGILWVTYGSTYLIRKPLGVIKSDMSRDLELSNMELGMLDTAMLLPYAVMQVLLGPATDKLGPRKTLVLCLLLGGVSMSIFGIWVSYPLCLLLLFISGTAQASCWPACSKALASWFPDPTTRNSVFGIFGTSGFIGGICGTALAVWTQSMYSWRFVHLMPSLMLFVVAIAVGMTIKSPREKVEAETVDQSEEAVDILQPPAVPKKSFRAKFCSWLSLWSTPLIPEITLTVFCLKLVRYCMYMWLPFYLLDYLKYSKTQAGFMSVAFEFGGGLGSACIGFIVSRVFQGRTLLALWLTVILSALSFLLFLLTAHWGPVANVLWLFLAGVGNCGPDALLGGAIPARLGERNGLEAGAALTGLVNGAGSLGTVIQGPMIGFISQQWDWTAVFLLMILLSGIATVSLLRALVRQQSLAILGKDNLDF